MAEILGTQLVAGIVPFTTEDQYPTHFAKYGKGGLRTVETIAERDAIPEQRKEIGMIVFVKENKKAYRLMPEGWIELENQEEVLSQAKEYTDQRILKDYNHVVTNKVDIISDKNGYSTLSEYQLQCQLNGSTVRAFSLADISTKEFENTRQAIWNKTAEQTGVYAGIFCAGATSGLGALKLTLHNTETNTTDIHYLCFIEDIPNQGAFLFVTTCEWNIETRYFGNKLFAYLQIPDSFTGSITVQAVRCNIKSGGNWNAFQTDGNSYTDHCSMVDYDTKTLYTDGQKFNLELCQSLYGELINDSMFLTPFGKYNIDIIYDFGDLEIGSKISDLVVNDSILHDLSKKASSLNLKIGGSNLAIYSTARVNNMTKDGNYGFTQITADTKTQLELKIDDYHGQSNYKTYVHNEIISTPGTYSFNITLKADTSVLRIKHNGSSRDVESIFTFSETIKSGEEIVVSITFTNVTQGEFSWKNVMIERGNKATDWSPALEDLEAYSDRQSGGENLYDRGDPTGTIPYYSTDSFLLSAVEPGKTYVGSYQQASEWAQFSCLILKSGDTPPTASFSYMDVYYTYGLNNIDGVYKWGEPIPVNGNDRRVYALVGITYENAKRLFKAGGHIDNECLVFDSTPVEGLEYYFKGIMLQEGERATGYQAATKHLTDAIENGSTEEAGGLVMTNVLMLKDEKGNVKAGISGVVGTADNPENVLMWGGGNYAEAFYAAINDYKKNAAGTLITTLLKKDGTGKIGVFRIGEDKVVVQTDDGMVVIDDNLGITCQRAGNAEPVIVVTPQELSNIEDLKDETVNVSNSDRNIANGENVTNGAEDSNFILRTETKTFSITVSNSTELTLAGGVGFNILNQTRGVTVWDEQSAEMNGVPQNAGIYAEIHNSQGSIIVSGVLNGSARNELKATLPNAGTYTISYYCRIFCDTTGSGRFSASIQITSSSLTYKYTYKEAKKKTMIAYKGLFSYQGETEYFYYKDGVGLECKMGDKKLKITKDGIYMDGLPTTSTNLQKGSIYKNGSQLCIV